MALVAGELITSARDEHPTFNDRRHPDPVLLRALSRYQRELFGKLIRLDSQKAVIYQDTALPLASFDAGIAVPTYKYPSGAEARTSTCTIGRQLKIVAWERRTEYHHAVYLRNGVLYLTGLESYWTDYDTIRFFYVPELAALAIDAAAMSAVLSLPDAAEATLVAFLALQMAKRGGAGDGETAPDAKVFGGEWVAAEDRFLDEMGRNTQAVSSVIRDVF